MIDELGETEREVIGICRRHVYSSAELSGRYLALIASINIDTAALQIESAICLQFRGFKSTSECMRVRPEAPHRSLLLSVNHSVEKCDMWGEYQTRERDLAGRATLLFKFT